jgi:hypothetical protein
MTSTGNHEADITEANEADVQEQALPVRSDDLEHQASPAMTSTLEANEADLQEQLEAVKSDDDDEYPRGEAE